MRASKNRPATQGMMTSDGRLGLVVADACGFEEPPRNAGDDDAHTCRWWNADEGTSKNRPATQGMMTRRYG